jgi:sulfate adenylyltransferase subunit 1 (EFTu-like GTPase family)
MPWFGGVPLLEHLETVELEADRNLEDVRFPVQWVIRDHDSGYRGYAGQVASGILSAGHEVVVLPSGVRTTVEAIDTADGEIDEAFPPMSVTLRLADDVDASRGDMIAAVGDEPAVTREIEADVSWMAQDALRQGTRLSLKHTTATVRAEVAELVDRLDVDTLDRDASPEALELNDIGRVRLRVSRELVVDPYGRNRTTGSFILIDEATNDTVGAGMIR